MIARVLSILDGFFVIHLSPIHKSWFFEIFLRTPLVLKKKRPSFCAFGSLILMIVFGSQGLNLIQKCKKMRYQVSKLMKMYRVLEVSGFVKKYRVS